MRRCRLAEISIRQIHVDAAGIDIRIAGEVYIVCPVEEIENLKPELEIDSFRNTRVFIDVDVRLNEIGPAEQIGFLITLRSESGDGEVGRGNCPCKPGAVLG